MPGAVYRGKEFRRLHQSACHFNNMLTITDYAIAGLKRLAVEDRETYHVYAINIDKIHVMLLENAKGIKTW